MPGFSHEALIELFRDQKELAPRLLAETLGVGIPDYTDVECLESTLTEIVPTEYRADLVLMLRRDEPVQGIVVEVQLSRDVEKRFSWPLYATALRARHRCPVAVLVVTPDQAVAEWAGEPITLQGNGSFYIPYVLGLSGIPQIKDIQVATERPHLAVLSALAHRNSPGGVEVVVAAIAGAVGLDDYHASLYHDCIMAGLNDSARKELETMVQAHGFEWQSEFAKRYVAEGLERGREEGREEGREQGRAEALLEILNARGLSISESARQKILDCHDLGQLNRWLQRAISVATVTELFD